jgi:hypothetical protein
VTTPDLIFLVKQVAAPFQLPWALVTAICLVESSGDEWAMRYEPRYKWLVGTEDTLTATERTGQMISWGLMQVMGGVARQYGYQGPLPKLCDPVTGLNYGMTHLQHFRTMYASWPDAIASYNAGSPRRSADGTYLNQSYLDKVTTLWNQQEAL